MKPLLVLSILLAIGCSKQEGAGLDLVKQVANEVKDKPRVEVKVRMTGDQPAAADEALLRTLETKVEEQHVGRLVSSGFEPGSMTLTVEVENTADAIDAIRKVLAGAGVLDRSTFRVMTEE
jgi:hypothetical protein